MGQEDGEPASSPTLHGRQQHAGQAWLGGCRAESRRDDLVLLSSPLICGRSVPGGAYQTCVCWAFPWARVPVIMWNAWAGRGERRAAGTRNRTGQSEPYPVCGGDVHVLSLSSCLTVPHSPSL